MWGPAQEAHFCNFCFDSQFILGSRLKGRPLCTTIVAGVYRGFARFRALGASSAPWESFLLACVLEPGF